MIVKNIALLGHKDHGKSTLIGSLLMQTGSATQVRINEAKMYSDRLHKPFEPAFILDSFAEEREQEMTYDTTRAEIKYNDLAFAFIDVPGHEELIKNMISGASYGEIAVLLVSAKKDEGIRDQTKRHLFISRMLGIDKLIVAVNKMDSVAYDGNRFDEIKKELSPFISMIGFEKGKVHYVPISAYNGENLVKKSSRMKWYRGDALMDVIYGLSAESDGRRRGALRIIVQGVVDSENNIIGGRIISGSLSQKDTVSILPQNKNASVKEIIVKGKKVKTADTGENVALKLDKKMDFEFRGTVIADSKDRPRLADSVRSRIFVTNAIGRKLQVKFNGIDVGCRGLKVLDEIDVTTGEKTGGKKPQVLNAIDAEVRFERKLPVEDYGTTKELGRFVLYSNSKFAGIGIITS